MRWDYWENLSNLESTSFVCGFCGHKVGSNVGYKYETDSNTNIYICTNCGAPSFFCASEQHPGPLLGKAVEGLPPSVEQVYKELRNSLKNGIYTATLLLGRKLIMHLAIDVARAREGEYFMSYIDHLKDSGYIPPNGDKILEYIKNLGNEKNHEIKVGRRQEAEKILKFVEGLLLFIYEFPAEFENIPD